MISKLKYPLFFTVFFLTFYFYAPFPHYEFRENKHGTFLRCNTITGCVERADSSTGYSLKWKRHVEG